MFASTNRNYHLTRAAALAVLLSVLLGCPALTARAAAPEGNADGVTFSITAPDAQGVFLAGDFNGWNAQDLPLTRGDDGLWSITVKLEPGDHQYKFVVDGEWLEDRDNSRKEADPFGGSNSLLTVAADGSIVGGGAPAPAPATAGTADTAAADIDLDRAGPQAVDGGVAFVYHNPDAGSVNLAGSMNGWSADATPLRDHGKGRWSVVVPLEAGEHQYKFVVDGNWTQDPGNGQAVSDGYGGSNSAVTVDDGGGLVASAETPAAASQASATLDTKVNLQGRYLTRFEFSKNVPVTVDSDDIVDPRWRLQRPSQSVDLNFDTQVSDVAHTLMRIRLDSESNIIQNNVAGFLDEATLNVAPSNFNLRAFWNQEVYSSHDLLGMAGHVDLPGTILNDDLGLGKGSAGALFESHPLGLNARLFFANYHNADYYNDPDLYDNTGEDKIGLRLSHGLGKFEIGLPLYLERTLVWADFGDLVSLTSTGIPTLDEHRANTGDSSTWYEIEDMDMFGGVDVRYDLDEKWDLGLQVLYNQSRQRLATGNEAGQNNTNGVIDVPFLDRDRVLVGGVVAFQPAANHDLTLTHINTGTDEGTADDRFLEWTYQDQSTANKNVFFAMSDSPAVAGQDSTDVVWNWRGEDRSGHLWLRRLSRSYDYGAVGRKAPQDSTVSSHDETIWYLAGRGVYGASDSKYGRYELEAGLTLADHGVADWKNSTTELIFRYDRDLTRKLGVLADIRYVKYHLEGQPDGSEALDLDSDYVNPFIGLRYTPIRRLELVAAYGVDPVDFSIDYDGRQLGRWWYRQNYLFDHPGATVLDAEESLKNARVLTLRAQLQF